jgi:uncharacterized membrane protein YhaH (DUF805 family)
MTGGSSLFHITAPINRRQFWIGVACLIAILTPLILVAGGMLRTQGATSLELGVFYIAAMIFIGGYLLLARKRLRDRGRPPWLALPYFIVPPLIVRVGDVVSNGQGIPTLLCYVLGYGLLIWTIVDLGVLGSRPSSDGLQSATNA